MEILFIGSGDAFGSGGRLQPCIAVTDEDLRFTLDFGLSSLIGLQRQGIHPNSIDAVILSHLHGDHCGGVPFLLMDAMLGSKRKKPLTIFGPEGTESHIRKLQEDLFPGSSIMEPRFPLEFVELNTDGPVNFEQYIISAVDARHTRLTKPLALKIKSVRETVVYTGDGELTETLIDFSRDADLLIAECYYFDKPVKWHLNYPDIKHLKVKSIILTHMHENMLLHKDEVVETCAFDGMKINL